MKRAAVRVVYLSDWELKGTSKAMSQAEVTKDNESEKQSSRAKTGDLEAAGTARDRICSSMGMVAGMVYTSYVNVS